MNSRRRNLPNRICGSYANDGSKLQNIKLVGLFIVRPMRGGTSLGRAFSKPYYSAEVRRKTDITPERAIKDVGLPADPGGSMRRITSRHKRHTTL
jgi:hypothetical protein